MHPRSQNAAAQAYKLLRDGRPELALPFAKAAVAAAIVCSPEHGLLATILCGLGQRREADRIVTSAMQLGVGCGDAYDALAYVSITLGQPQQANVLYRRAVEREPLSSRLWYNLAASERSLGQTVEAERACDRSIALDQLAYQSYVLRSDLRVQTMDANHIAELELLLADRNKDQRARVAFGYALGKELDDLERYDEAYIHFSDAAQARRRHLAYNVSVDIEKIRRIKEIYSPEYLRNPGSRRESVRYLFIIGLPRSGTTLLERILTGIAGVRTNGETDNFARALLGGTPPGIGEVFSRASRGDPDEIARKYAELAGATDDSDLIVEKLPMNYLYLGAIHHALPDAKLLWMRRAPIDSCFAMYRTLFGQAYPFSYDFDDLAHYYAAYDGLMTHWQACLGAHLYPVRYEELVTRPDRIGAAVAAHCGLPWDASALHIEYNAGASFTASASQARRPIYTASVGRWQRYGKHLEPLASRLAKLGVATES